MSLGRLLVLILFAAAICVIIGVAAVVFVKPVFETEFVVRPTELPLAPPTLSLDETRYITRLGSVTVEHSAAVSTVRGLLMKATNNISLVDNESWRSQLDASLDVIRSADAVLRGMNAPARFEGCQDQMLSAVDIYDLVVTTASTGVDSNDRHMIDMSVRLIDYANDDLQQALECFKHVDR